MSTQSSSTKEALNWLQNWLSSQSLSGSPELTLLAGDGSPRQFFRATVSQMSYVLMRDPTWTLSKDYSAHRNFLDEKGIPVPRFHREDPKAGFLLMEDLGDELLQFRIQRRPAQRKAWLKEAVALLSRLHVSTFPVPQDLPVAGRRFDEQKLSEELAFTYEHLSQKFLGLPAASPKEWERIVAFCREIEEMKPLVFCHRDYHCRNLMLHDEKLSMIDFQDARLGPPHYDLASLVYDPYVGLSNEERQDLVAQYRDAVLKSAVGHQIDWKNFDRNLEKVALQRLVKAAGSFASFYTRYGKTTHLPYLVPALRSARALAPTKSFPLDLWIQKASVLVP